MLKHAVRVAIFRLRKHKVTYSCETAKRYSGSGSTRSPMTGKSKAIFRLQKPKVTYPAKKQSDIPAPEAQGHLFLRDSKAIFRLRKDKVTHLEVCL